MGYTTDMKLIVALGNPGAEYKNTRHNVGWMLVDQFASEHSLRFATKSKFHGAIAELNRAGEKTLFLKPATFYNLAGESARAVSDFYKIATDDILIVHDDLALPLGTLRTRIGGSDAGNNGIKSITQHLGEGTARLRVGTWTEHRETTDDADFVLSALNSDERKAILDVSSKANDIINSFIAGTFVTTTHR
jgi:PTH1 family peptidyl-tRNA hydrolase